MSDDPAGYDPILKAAKNAIRRAEYWKSEHTIANAIIEKLRAENQALREALEAVVRDHEWLANIADLQNMPRPEWYNKAQAALKLVRGT